MKFKDENNTEKTGQGAEGDYHQDDDYQIWRKQKSSTFSNKLFKRIEIPLVFLGVGLAVLIILFIVSISKTKKPAFDDEFTSIEKRLAQIEDRLNNLETGKGDATSLQNQSKALKELQNKLQRAESSMSRKMNKISAEVGKIKKITAGLKSAKPTSSAPSQTKTQKRVHLVGAGETFYSISRQYGITVEELLRLNNLSADAVIHPGQELVVGP